MISSADLVVGTGRRFGPAARSRRAASSIVRPTGAGGVGLGSGSTAAGVSVSQAVPSSEDGGREVREAPPRLRLPSAGRYPRRLRGPPVAAAGPGEAGVRRTAPAHCRWTVYWAGRDRPDRPPRGDLLKLKGEARLVPQPGNAQPRAPMHRSGENTHLRRLGQGHLSVRRGARRRKSGAEGVGAGLVDCIWWTVPRAHHGVYGHSTIR